MAATAERARSLHARLLALTTNELAPPHVDPRVAALAALGLVDFAKSDEGRARFAELEALDAFDPKSLDDLEMLAEALLRVVETFDVAPRTPKPITIPQPLEIDCRARRGLMAAMLSERLADGPTVARAVRQLRLSYGPLDLAVDLRALAKLVEANDAALAGAPGWEPDLAASSRALAAQLESLLYGADTPELHQARGALHRMWALFERAYRDVAALGRELFADHADEIFPSLEAIAEVQRTARHQSSSRMPAAAIVERSIPQSRRGMSRRPSSRRMPAVRPLPDGAAPLALEIALSATSESNLWLGFSQDVAEGGIFVATYETRPLGALIDLLVQLEGVEDPISLSASVHWVRPHSVDSDLPAGFGVRLLDVSSNVTKALQKFAVKRTPIFYDD